MLGGSLGNNDDWSVRLCRFQELKEGGWELSTTSKVASAIRCDWTLANILEADLHVVRLGAWHGPREGQSDPSAFISLKVPPQVLPLKVGNEGINYSATIPAFLSVILDRTDDKASFHLGMVLPPLCWVYFVYFGPETAEEWSNTLASSSSSVSLRSAT